MKMSRTWAMPNAKTFSIPPIAALLDQWITDTGPVSIDPFCGSSTRGTHRNDLAISGKTANEWLDQWAARLPFADAVLFDPPYSPRQISECYKSVGLAVGMKETQNGRLYKDARDRLSRLLKVDGIGISCGWNSAGFGVSRGFEIEEILLVAHGGAHNDTIVVVERKTR